MYSPPLHVSTISECSSIRLARWWLCPVVWFVLLVTIGFAEASIQTVSLEALPASHLTPLGRYRVTLTAAAARKKGSLQNTEIWVPLAPEATTQFDVTNRVDLYSIESNRLIPPSAYERTEFTYTSEDSRTFKQKALLFWFPGTSPYLKEGVKVLHTIELRLFRATLPIEVGPDRPDGFEGETLVSDLRSPSVQGFARNIQRDHEQSGDSIDIAVIRQAALHTDYTRVAVSDHKASEALRIRAGSCDLLSALVMTGYRSANIPARTEWGYILMGPTGTNGEKHVRVARLFNGWWFPIEASNKHADKRPDLSIGTNGQSSPDFLILSYGAMPRAKVKTKDGIEHELYEFDFRRPAVRFKFMEAPAGASTAERNANMIAALKFKNGIEVTQNYYGVTVQRLAD